MKGLLAFGETGCFIGSMGGKMLILRMRRITFEAITTIQSQWLRARKQVPKRGSLFIQKFILGGFCDALFALGYSGDDVFFPDVESLSLSDAEISPMKSSYNTRDFIDFCKVLFLVKILRIFPTIPLYY